MQLLIIWVPVPLANVRNQVDQDSLARQLFPSAQAMYRLRGRMWARQQLKASGSGSMTRTGLGAAARAGLGAAARAGRGAAASAGRGAEWLVAAAAVPAERPSVTAAASAGMRAAR